MPPLRTFIALDPGEELAAEAASLLGRLRASEGAPRASWIPPRNFHITLRFLGPTAPEQVEPLSKTMRRSLAGEPPLPVELTSLGAFASLASAHVLFWHVNDPAGRLARLFERIEHEAQALGFAPEPRAYHPHLTLAFLEAPCDLRSWAEAARPSPFKAELPSVSLYRSDNAPGGVRYTPLSTVPLLP